MVARPGSPSQEADAPARSPNLESALAYASRGWPVLPLHTPTETGCSCRHPECRHIGKHPRTEHGLFDASTDEAVIRQWWTRWPDANIGVATGTASGLVVLDIDPRQAGNETLADLERGHGALPHTVESVTGGGGRHTFFRHPDGHTKSRNLAPGIDIKADGGYVVAPPSLHASGRQYEWELSCHPDETLLASLPGWLQRLPMQTGGPPTHTDPARPICEGERNARLTSLAGTMRRRGMGESAVLAALLEHNRQRCEPPLPEDEVRKIAAGIMRYQPALDSEGMHASSRGHDMPVIYASCQVLPEVTQQCWAALDRANHPPAVVPTRGNPCEA